MTALARAAARVSPAAKPDFTWEVTEGPWFDNNVALLRFEGGSAQLSIHRAVLGEGDHPRLEVLLDRPL